MQAADERRDVTRAEEQREERQRFARLRVLIYNDSLRHRFLLVVNLIALTIIGGLTFLAATLPQSAVDLSISQGFQTFGGYSFRELMILVSLPGTQPWATFIVLGGILFLGVMLGWKEGAYLFLVTLAQGLANTIFKQAISRARPTAELIDIIVPAPGFSFPSGHVMFYTGFFGFLFFVVWTRFPRSLGRNALLLLTGALVLLVGPSRVYLGVHWFTDVVAAYLVSLIILSVTVELYLHYLVPPRDTEEGGLIGEHHRELEQTIEA